MFKLDNISKPGCFSQKLMKTTENKENSIKYFIYLFFFSFSYQDPS